MNYNLDKKTEYDISCELEYMILKELNIDFHHTEAIFDCSRIEKEMFIDTMEFLLILKNKMDLDFIDKYYVYKMKDMKKIPEYKQIYIEFLNLLEK